VRSPQSDLLSSPSTQVESASLVEGGDDVSFSQETVLVTDDYLVI
jgi:hypothetical protein